MLKTNGLVLCAVGLFLAGPAFAAPDFTGVWRLDGDANVTSVHDRADLDHDVVADENAFADATSQDQSHRVSLVVWR